jgi:hypothetical protein
MFMKATFLSKHSYVTCYLTFSDTVISYPTASEKYIILTCAVLYGCESSSLTLRDEHGLRLLENRVLRGLPGCDRRWRELFNQQVERKEKQQVPLKHWYSLTRLDGVRTQKTTVETSTLM